jgi:uncharacterized membrane protein YfcA
MSEIEANASNFVALLPANVASLYGYRHELRRPTLRLGPRLVLAGFGGACGSLALLGLGEASFRSAIPWLLTFSTLSFALAPAIKRWLDRRHQFDAGRWIWLSFLLEFIVYAYGGYFGLGMSVVLLALYGMFGHDDIHEANAIRNAVITLITLIGIALFAHAGIIRWLPSLVMMVGALLGGYLTIQVARSVPQIWVRWGILAWSVALTAIAFWRYA